MDFGHHPDPATDFCVEVEAIEAEVVDRAAGLPATMDLSARIERAMQFKIGGDADAVAAKVDLRKIEAAFKAGASALALPQAPKAGANVDAATQWANELVGVSNRILTGRTGLADANVCMRIADALVAHAPALMAR